MSFVHRLYFMRLAVYSAGILSHHLVSSTATPSFVDTIHLKRPGYTIFDMYTHSIRPLSRPAIRFNLDLSAVALGPDWT